MWGFPSQENVKDYLMSEEIIFKRMEFLTRYGKRSKFAHEEGKRECGSRLTLDHELPKPSIYEKALWPLEEGILEADQADLNKKGYIR